MLSRRQGIGFAVVGVLALGCSRPDALEVKQQKAVTPPATSAAVTESPQPAESPAGPFRFADVAKSAGIHFRHDSPLTEQRHVHLVMGSGIGWFDFDNDGWPDLYCCQGAAFEGSPKAEPASNALFWNRQGGFREMTRQAGLVDTDYSMGIASADFDNDGFADLCVTGYGSNTLLHNQGDGTFMPVALPQQSFPGRLSANCSWGDMDADGDLDLYITNYAKLGPEHYPTCENSATGKTIHTVCHPSSWDRMQDLLYRNEGEGQFVEVSQAAGIADGEGRQGLGVVASDLDRDGDTDFYVANDTTPNFLWENRGNGQFIDRGADSGTATNRHGAREAGMGIAVGDVDGNGQLDLLVTNFYNETNTLYRNEGGFLFADVTEEVGLGASSRRRLGFGASFADFDNDGWLDLLTANGHIHDRLHEMGREGSFAQLAQVFDNDGGTRFEDVSASSGLYFREPHVGRGTAIADFDRDGDLDAAISNLNGDLALLENDAEGIGRWLRVQLRGTRSNRDGIGAVLHVDLGDRVLVRSVQAGASYLSCDERALLIGIGSSDKVRELTVVWPGGQRESWSDLETNGPCYLVQGSGRNKDAR